MSIYRYPARSVEQLTRCQVGVLSVLNENLASLGEVWNRTPMKVYSNGEAWAMAYGTIGQILPGLCDLGLAEYEQNAFGLKTYRITSSGVSRLRGLLPKEDLVDSELGDSIDHRS